MLSRRFSNRLYVHCILKHQSYVSSNILTSSRKISQPALKEECTTTYMPIVDMSYEGQKRHERQKWYNYIQSLPTVEEKLYEFAIQVKPRLKKHVLTSVPNNYNGADYYPYITRTHLVKGLPEKLQQMNVDDELNEVRDIFCEELRKYYSSDNLKNLLEGRNAGSNLLKNLVSQAFKKLALRNSYVMESTIQTKPRINSFWWHGGFPSKEKKINEENKCFRFTDYPSFIIRTKVPLNPILDMKDPLCATADVPQYNYDPSTFRMIALRNNLTSVPGYWPGEECEFPFLLVHPWNSLKPLLNKIEKYDLSKIENSVGIMSSFGWLNAVATYQGFSPFHDVTYPLTTHTILTNGQDWLFFVYQLNTLALHADVDGRDRRNLCWSSGRMRLFQAVEGGRVRGIDDRVFQFLLKFLLNAPVPQENLVLKPYLGEDVRTEDDANNMRYLFRGMYSQAPLPRAHENEIPTWRRIYKLHKDAPPCPYLRDC